MCVREMRVKRVGRSVCGQNKMYPVLKGAFKLPIWAETVVGSIPLHNPPWLHIKSFHTSKSAHSPRAIFSSFLSHRRGNRGTSSQLKHTSAPKTHLTQLWYLHGLLQIDTSDHSTCKYFPCYSTATKISSTSCNKLRSGTSLCPGTPVNHPNTPCCELITSLTAFHVLVRVECVGSVVVPN